MNVRGVAGIVFGCMLAVMITRFIGLRRVLRELGRLKNRPVMFEMRRRGLRHDQGLIVLPWIAEGVVDHLTKRRSPAARAEDDSRQVH